MFSSATSTSKETSKEKPGDNSKTPVSKASKSLDAALTPSTVGNRFTGNRAAGPAKRITKPVVDEVSSSDDESEGSSSGSSDSGDEAGSPSEDQADFLGNIKTCLCWSMKDKQPGVLVRQVLETSRRMQLKVKGHLNTQSGDLNWKTLLRKNVFTSPLTKSSLHRVYLAASQRRRGILLDEPHLDPQSWLPAGLKALLMRDWVISPGVTFNRGGDLACLGSSSAGDGLRYTLGLRKAPQVVKLMGRTDVWFSSKADCYLDQKNQEVSGDAGLRLKLFKYNVTSKQDLKVTVGLDVAHAKGAIQQSPYFKLAENNWAIKLQRGQWIGTFEL